MDVCSTRTRLGRAFVVGTGIGLLVMPAAARAKPGPVITKPPVIAGTPQVGMELVADAEYFGDPEPTPTYAWQRCAKPNGGPCTAIAGATEQGYAVAAWDVGTFLRVRIKVTNRAGSATAQSRPTTVVLGAPPPPVPVPVPVPPVPAPAPPAATPPPAPVAAPAAAPVPAAPAPLVPLVFDPFPVVRIKGELTAKGARVTLLSVRAPRDVRIDVNCIGAGCPARHYRAPAGQHRLRKFERTLRAGTRLEVRVTKPGYVGKFTAFTIRRHAAPKRSDRCLAPGAIGPVTCG